MADAAAAATGAGEEVSIWKWERKYKRWRRYWSNEERFVPVEFWLVDRWRWSA